MKFSNRPALRRATLLAGAAALMTVAAPAFAQESADPTPAAESDANSEIVVTAQKRSERLQDVPASVSVVTADNLTEQGIVKFEDYANRVPGLSLASARPGLTQVSLRGITTGPVQSAAATSFYVGEAPIGSVNAYTGGSNTTLDLDPSDLAQIEVLKGPQGTLYGANSMGGLIKYVTAEPDYNSIGGRASAAVNSVAHGGTGYGFRAAINLPIIDDKLVVRVSGFRRHDAGYIDIVSSPAAGKDVNYADVTGGRALVGFRLGSAVEVQLQAIGQDLETGGQNTIDVDATTLQPLYGELQTRRFTREPGKTKFRLYNGLIRADLGGIELLSSSTYQIVRAYTHADGSPGFGAALGGIGIRSNQETRVERFSQELRATATGLAGDMLDLQVGGYYTKEDDINRIPFFDVFDPATGATLPFPNIVTASIASTYAEYSAFANATVRFSDKFDILLGGRYSHEDQTYAHDYAGAIIPGGTNVGTGTEKADIFTFLVTPRFKISDDAMVYARVSSGYRPGGPNPPGVGAPPSFAADKLTSYEAGVKFSAFDKMLSFDASLFYINWKDVQIQTSAGGFNFIVNGGDALSQGGEVSISLTPMRGLTFGLNAAYTDAHLTEDAPAAGGLKGDRMPFAPDWTASLTANYAWALSSNVDANIGGSLNHTGERVSNYTNKAPRTVDDFTTVNLNAGVQFGNVSLSIFGKNLTDERGVLALGTLGLTPASNPFAKALITPRTVGAEIAFKF